MQTAPQKRATLGAYLVGAYLFIVPAFSYSDTLGLTMVPQIMGVLLVAYAVLDIVNGRKIKIPSEIQVYGLLGLWAAATFLFGASTSELKPLGTIVKVVVMTMACAQLIKDETDLYAALRIFVFSILLVYYQNAADLELLRTSSHITDEDRFAGTLTNANTAAMLSLTVVWASMLLLLHAKKGLFSRALYFLPMGISLLVIYYSGSKKGFIGIALFALFAGRLFYMRQHKSVFRKGLVILGSAALIIVAGYFIYASPFFFRLQEEVYSKSGSTLNRWTLVGEAIEVWLTNLKTFVMGVGYDNFRLFSVFQTYSHSTPTELLANNGIVGFCLFAGFLFLLFRKFIFLYRRAPDRELRSAFFLVLIFLSVFTFFSVAAVMHDARELLPVLGGLAAFGQYHVLRLRRGQENEVSPPASE